MLRKALDKTHWVVKERSYVRSKTEGSLRLPFDNYVIRLQSSLNPLCAMHKGEKVARTKSLRSNSVFKPMDLPTVARAEVFCIKDTLSIIHDLHHIANGRMRNGESPKLIMKKLWQMRNIISHEPHSIRCILLYRYLNKVISSTKSAMQNCRILNTECLGDEIRTERQDLLLPIILRS